MPVGFCDDDVFGLAPKNVQFHDVGELVLRSVKLTESFTQMVDWFEVKFAIGALPQLFTVM